MEYDQINHDTSAIDAAMKAARDRDLMGARSVLNGSRTKLLVSSIPVALVAGTMFIGAAVASAWIMRPHFDFHTVQIDVPKLVEKQIDAPKLVDREVEIPKLVERNVEVPKLVERPVEVPWAAPGPLAGALPPKTPDRAEQKFIDRPDYRLADFKGRLVPPDENEVKFDDGKQFYPVRVVNGEPTEQTDYTVKNDVDGYIGDYGYCNHDPKKPKLYYCWVIHNDAVTRIAHKPYFKAGQG